MIENRKEAAYIAAGIPLAALEARQFDAFPMDAFFEKNFESVFDETLQYHFHAEAFWIHQSGKGHPEFAGSWAEVFPSVKLALTLYCTNVPVLAALIATPKVEEAGGDPSKSRFESVNNEDDNGKGTIYEREGFAARPAAEPEPPAVPETPGADQADGAGAGAAAGTETETSGDAAQDPAPLSEAAGAAAVEVVGAAYRAAVTENTDDESQLHPNAEVVVNDRPGEGGDVVDDDADDEGDEGGGVEGDDDVIDNDPPAETAPKKNRKKKT